MRNIIFILLISLFITNSNAQFKISMGASCGIGMPLGDFKTTDSNFLRGAGFANPGINIKVFSDFDIIKNLGASLIFNLNNNGVNQDDFTNHSNESENDGFNFDIITLPIESYSILLGPNYSVIKRERFQIKVNLLVGYSQVYRGGSLWWGTKGYNNYAEVLVIEESDVNKGTFSYDFGSNISLNITRKISIKLMFDYYGTKIEFENVNYDWSWSSTQSNSSGSDSYDKIVVKQQILNLCAGVSYSF